MLVIGCGGHGRSAVGDAPSAPAGVTTPLFPSPPGGRPVSVGAEELDTPAGRRLRGLRVGLIANAASVTRNGRPSVQVLRAHGGHVVRLFSPEHGYRAQGAAGARQGDGRAFGDCDVDRR